VAVVAPLQMHRTAFLADLVAEEVTTTVQALGVQVHKDLREDQ